MERGEYSCPRCGSPLTLRRGHRGEFWGCSAYPRCRAALERGADGASVPPPDTGVKCGACDAPAGVRLGPRGRFLACSTYPRCRWTKVIEDSAK
jgi:DNA topoisomerase-1